MPSSVGRTTTILIHGAAGRMGRTLAAMVPRTEGIVLAGYIDTRARSLEPLDHLPYFDDIPRGEGGVDAVVDFTRPEAIRPLLEVLKGTGVALVSGTTGLGQSERNMLEKYSEEGAVFYDDNMSYGVSVMKTLVETAGRLLGRQTDVDVVEYHHRGKRDHPSGTTYGLVKALDPEAVVVEGRGEAPDGVRVVRTHSVRAGGIPGEHQVHFSADDEVVTVTHRAISRDVFARGALQAVRFVVEKQPGLYSMRDLTGG